MMQSAGHSRTLLLPLALLALAACGDRSDSETAARNNPAIATPRAAAAPEANAAPDPATAPPGPSKTEKGSLTSIPIAYHGWWAKQLADCNGDDEMRLRIEADQLLFYESAGRPRSIRQVDPRTLELDLAMAGEGMAWTDRYRMTLSSDGQSLISARGVDGNVTRIRCPTGTTR